MVATLFEYEPTAHACGPLPFSPYVAPRKRRNGAAPTHISRIPRETDIAAAVFGSELQGLPLLPQGMHVAGVLEARDRDGLPLYPTVGILIPRRGTKTTSIWNVILGRCRNQPGHKVAVTAQDGLRARNRMREVMRALQARDFEGDRNPSSRLGKLRWSNGEEAIEWDNGSRIWVVPPESGAFRGEAADTMFFDEAGELSLTRSEDLLAGALPLMDTRPMGQVIIAGTPAKTRAGLLWSTLEAARNGDKSVGIVDYSIRDHEPSVIYPEDGGDPVLNEKVLRRVHPGIGTLTTLRKMRDRFAKMDLATFEREYLCRFPLTDSSGAFDLDQWTEAGLEVLPPRPARVGLGFDVAPDGSAAALAAAWRDSEGVAHLEVIAYRPGVAWLPVAAREAHRKHRTPIGHDTIGANTDPADQMHRLRVGLSPLNLRAMQGAAQRFMTELDEGRLRHYRQPDLDRAVEGAAWRTVGEGGRLFGRKASAHEVSPLVACSVALWQYDTMGRRSTPRITMRTA